MQSRRHSALGTLTNIAIRYAPAVASQFDTFPPLGIHASSKTHFAIAGWFTVTSVIRAYAMRQLFNRWESR